MIGSVVGNYRIIEEIGEGGMGKVYKGVDQLIDREVAIKVLRPELTNQKHLVDRFRAEATMLAKLNHRHIAMLYSFFRQEELYFMAMEFIRGERLDHRMQRLKRLPYKDAIELFHQILEAIGHAHEHGVIHRDLKPNNIMIAPGDVVKVMDFGIARVLGAERMTREGAVIGTLEYMAPEQVRGLESNEATDIYSLGVLLYEMLCGRLPFASANQFDLMRAHIETPPPPPRLHAPHIPEHIEAAILRALAKKQDDRFRQASEFSAALIVEDRPPKGRGPATKPLRKTAGYSPPPDSDAAPEEDRRRQAEEAAAETKRQLIEDARKQVQEEAARIAEEERHKLIEEARKQAEAEAARFAEKERHRLIKEARRLAEQEAARMAETERQSLIEEARKLAEQEAAQRAAAERQRMVDEARKRAEREAAQRAESERLRLVEIARRQAEQQAAHLAQAERQRLVDKARIRAEQEAARLAVEEEQRLVEEARKQAEAEAAKFAVAERQRLIEEAHKRAEIEAAQRAAADRKRLFDDARKQAEQEAAARASAERKRLFDDARKQAEEEAARIAAEEEQRLFEAARKKAEEEATQLVVQERTRLLEEALRQAGQEASQRASKERQRLVEAARKRAQEEAAQLVAEERQRLIEQARGQAEEEAARLAEEERKRLIEEAHRQAEQEAAHRAASERVLLIENARKRAEQEAARRAAAERQRMVEEARKQAELEAERLASEIEQRLLEQARMSAEQEVTRFAEEERQRLLDEARRKAEQQAAEKASKERKRLVEVARKRAEQEAANLAEEERQQRVEEALKQAEQEAAKFAEEELQRLLEEARKKTEREALRRAEKERKRLFAEERKRAKQEAQRQSAEMIQTSDPYGTTRLNDGSAPDPDSDAPLGSLESYGGRSFNLPVIGGSLLALAILAGAIYFVARNTSQNASKGAEPEDAKTAPKPTPDMVRIPGGAFQLGRADQPRRGSGEDEIWAYVQWPAHRVTVEPFAIDRTEVTNAEYAQFIRETRHSAPPDWVNGEPPPGRENWPVVNVSYVDAEKFALWRSLRDGVNYRLPTEVEWEYAAKGPKDYRYPWGNEWRGQCANVGSKAPTPVGSYAQDKQCGSVWGAQDLLGNVWEWTSSRASLYRGNTEIVLDEVARTKHVVRGGSFADSPNGKEPIRVTVRLWGEDSVKDPTIGFRLVRSGG